VNTHTEDDLRAALAHEADAGPPVVDVWPRLHRGIVVRRWARAGAAAAGAGAIAAALIVALPTGHDNVRVPPARGNGTATLVPEHPLSNADLGLSVNIIRHRIDALGISGAMISTRDGAIDLRASGVSRTELVAIAAQGVLNLMSVNAVSSISSPCPTTGGDLACISDGRAHYTLGPIALDNSDVKGADVSRDMEIGGWLVTMQFDQAGTQEFHTLTADAAAKPWPNVGCGPPKGCNAIAIVLDRTVLAVPSVQQRGGIPGGQTQITGFTTKAQAQVLAAIVANPPLPTAFSVG